MLEECSCGGEAKVFKADDKAVKIYCSRCYKESAFFPSEPDALRWWNSGGSDTAQRIAVPKQKAGFYCYE